MILGRKRKIQTFTILQWSLLKDLPIIFIIMNNKKSPISIYRHQYYNLNRGAISEYYLVKNAAKKIKNGGVNEYIGKTDPFSLKVINCVNSGENKFGPTISPTVYKSAKGRIVENYKKKNNPDLYNFHVRFD